MKAFINSTISIAAKLEDYTLSKIRALMSTLGRDCINFRHKDDADNVLWRKLNKLADDGGNPFKIDAVPFYRLWLILINWHELILFVICR